MFRMQGNIVGLIRHRVSYTERKRDKTIDSVLEEDKLPIEGERIRRKVSYTEREHVITIDSVSEEDMLSIEDKLTEKGIEFTTETIDQAGNEWFDGLEFDSYDEALEVFNGGEVAYLRSLRDKHLSSNEQLRADTDYLAVMLGVEM